MKVHVFGSLRSLVGVSEIEVGVGPGEPVRQMLEQLARTYPALGEQMLDRERNLQGLVHVLVNGRNVAFLQGLGTVVREGDRVALFPPVGGG